MPVSSFFAESLSQATRGLVRRRRMVLVVSLLAVVVAVGATVRWMGFKPSRLDLLNPHSEFNQRWLAYLDEFGDGDDLLVIVSGPSAEPIQAAIDDVAQELMLRPDEFSAVLYRTDLSRFRGKALHYAPASDLDRLSDVLDRCDPLLQGDWNNWTPLRMMRLAEPSPIATSPVTVSQTGFSSLDATNAGPAAGAFDPQTLAVLLPWLEGVTAAMEGRAAAEAELTALPQLSERLFEFAPRYLMTQDGRLGFCALRLASNEQKLVKGEREIGLLRSILDRVARRHDSVRIGLTGMPVLEFDEMQSSQRDMTIASVVSLIGVLLLLLAGFGNVRYSLLAMLILIVGMAWSFGFVTLAVGHLNLLSVSFAAILIGLGIDFGIHLLARYVQHRHEGMPRGAALVTTVRDLGPGIITGAVTTACAFFAAAMTEFTGVAELGIIAGGGILLCLTASLIVLPPLVYWLDRRWRPTQTVHALPVGFLVNSLRTRPIVWSGGVLVVAVAASFGINDLRYDHNLLNLQPKHIDSVRWERKLLSGGGRSVWFAVATAATRDELLERKAQFLALPSVERVEEIASLLPNESDERQRQIADLHHRLDGLPEQVPLLPALTPQQLQAEFGAMQRMMGAISTGAPDAARLAARLDRAMRELAPPEVARRLSAFHQLATQRLVDQLREVRSISDPEPPNRSDLPEALAARFIGRQGRHLMRVYAKGDIWDMEALERFVRDTEEVDPQVTGHPIQTYYASRQMQQSYLYAAIYSLLAVLIVLMLDFQNLGHALLAFAPLLLGLSAMLGILGWFDIPLNAANMIVLPLVLGIGVDNGVHVVHDWRAQAGKAYALSPSVAVAMLLCSSTTMVGFCTMMFAKHQGLRTLGQVLTLGIACCLLTSIGFLPPLLRLLSQWGARRRGDANACPDDT